MVAISSNRFQKGQSKSSVGLNYIEMREKVKIGSSNFQISTYCFILILIRIK